MSTHVTDVLRATDAAWFGADCPGYLEAISAASE